MFRSIKGYFCKQSFTCVLQICKERILLIGCRRECCVFGFAKILAHIRSTENATPFSCNYTQQTEEKSYLIECLESISICFWTKDKTALVKNIITRSDILQGQKQQLPCGVWCHVGQFVKNLLKFIKNVEKIQFLKICFYF